MKDEPTKSAGVVERERFEREDRYIVFKKSHLTQEQLEKVERLIHEGPRGLPSSSHDWPLPTVHCVVIESDWPEYELAWQMIEKRMQNA